MLREIKISVKTLCYPGLFEMVHLAKDQLQPFNNFLLGFSSGQVQVKGYITLKNTFRTGENVETLKV
ncbi:hypothetical protein MTR_1g074920 [Medicago truncatula]|uniref:Uncharacterized protein n=1 Tax=Medicago truncatula TaxID=3880 RepID=G7I3V4_MEDTR|nr:hypothetical protein MTR_1g074920 [Medicago truncatula]